MTKPAIVSISSKTPVILTKLVTKQILDQSRFETIQDSIQCSPRQKTIKTRAHLRAKDSDHFRTT
jgi:hypothetical protein